MNQRDTIIARSHSPPRVRSTTHHSASRPASRHYVYMYMKPTVTTCPTLMVQAHTHKSYRDRKTQSKNFTQSTDTRTRQNPNGATHPDTATDQPQGDGHWARLNAGTPKDGGFKDTKSTQKIEEDQRRP